MFLAIPIVNILILTGNNPSDNLCFKYASSVYGLIFRSVKNPELAESIFSKVYAEIQKDIPTVPTLSNGELLKVISVTKRVIRQCGYQVAYPSESQFKLEVECDPEKKVFQDKTIFDCYTVNQVSNKSGLPVSEIMRCIRQSVKKLRNPTKQHINLR